MKRLTISEIAALAEVSTATVSRVLNGNKAVSLETRRHIQEIIADHNYQPNILARSLSLKKTHNIGLIISHTADYLFTSPYFSKLIQAISYHANSQSYRLVLSTTKGEHSPEDTYDELLHGVVEGLIVLDIQVHDKRLIWLEDNHIPFVLIGCSPEYPNVNYVDSDNVTGAYRATKYLLELGHKKVFFLNGTPEYVVFVSRERGYRQALQEAGIQPAQGQVVYGGISVEAGYNLAQEFCHYARDDFGLLTASDLQACGAIAALKRTGLRVGHKVSVIGFDDIPLAQALDPPLTTVRQPIYQIGVEATRILIYQVEHPDEPCIQKVFPTELVIRQSTRHEA